MKSEQVLSSASLPLPGSSCTIIILTHTLLLLSILAAQPKDRIEFQVNICTGILTDALDDNPIYAIKVEILSGSDKLKDSTFTDREGKYRIDPVGYLWRPRIRFTSSDYYKKVVILTEDHLDEENNLNLNISLNPIPDEEKPKIFSKGTITSRAKTFFWKGNIFYHLGSNNSAADHNVSRIVINKVRTDKTPQGELLIWINGQEMNPLLCYVPQDGRYENLLAILSGYFPEPIFQRSGLPRFLDDDLLEPTVIFGRIMDAVTDEPVMGAEVSMIGVDHNRRITGPDGKFAFQILEAGEFFLDVVPPLHSRYKNPTKTKLIIKKARGGWYKSNLVLFPKDRSHWAQ